ncbi:MAG: hypothetical protein M1163_05625 [Candidatus Thermoplasmatota archaeon]|nr:hypothetical protein [Candidatus Thermoplasmatota archaeon]
MDKWRDSLGVVSRFEKFTEAVGAIAEHPFASSFVVSVLLFLFGLGTVLRESKMLSIPFSILVFEFPPPKFWLWELAGIAFWIGIAGIILTPSVGIALAIANRKKRH